MIPIVGMVCLRRNARRVAVVIATIVLGGLAATVTRAAGATTRGRGSLTITALGLPAGQQPTIFLSGRGSKRSVTSVRAHLTVPSGHYVVSVRPVVVRRATRNVRGGAIAYPARRKLVLSVRLGHQTSVTVRYAGVVNPGVRAAPSIVAVIGDPRNPTAIVLAAGTPAPQVGTIFTSGPTKLLPLGLVARVTRIGRKQRRLILTSVSTVPVADVVPSLTFSGALQLAPVPGSTTAIGARAHASSACTKPNLANFKAHLDTVELREAFIGLWPPQVKLTTAVRTTEAIGVSLAAVAVNCDWTGPELGPYAAAVPVGPVPVPVYATLPFKAGIHVSGALQAGTLNVASTTVAHTAAGGDENAASLDEQGSNVWVSGVLALTGSAKLSASIGLQAGLGVAKAGNLHVEAGFGPEFAWTSGHECELNVDLGSLSAGVSVLGHSLNTPSFTPFKLNLWRGCQPGTTGGGGSGGGDGGGGGSGGSGGGGVVPLTNANQVAAGAEVTCSLSTSRSVECWGSNLWGMLGAGITVGSDVPVAVSGITSAIELAAGGEDPTFGENACAVLSSGGLECWGGDENGQLGDGATTFRSDVPVAVSGITSATQVSVEFNKACAVLASGITKCWGFGPLGDGNSGDSSVPVTVSGITSATQVAAGGNHACARLSSGSVRCWGENGAGQLGDGSETESLVPVTVSGITTAIQVAAAGPMTCALLSGGDVRCWGVLNGSGVSTIPLPVEGIANATEITVGGEEPCALLSGGTIKCWGNNNFGQLGDGSTASSNTPVKVAGITNATQITASSGHACAVLAGGSVDCWGRNESGQLGDGNTIDSHVPVVVSAPQ